MPREASIEVAYVPFKTFITALDTLNQALPDTLDRSVFKNQSGSTQAMLMSTFRALELVNENDETQPQLRRLVDPGQRKSALSEIIQSKYKPVLDLGPNATQKQFDDAFYAFGVGGDTHKKAKSFFLQAAEMLGLQLSPHIAQAKSSNGSRPSAPRKPRKPRKLRETKPPDDNANDSGGRTPSRLHPVIQAWIDEMPADGEVWSRQDFDSWLEIFRRSAERVYKIPQM